MNIQEILQIHLIEYNSHTNYAVKVPGTVRTYSTIGTYSSWGGLGSFLDYDGERFTWRSDYERYLLGQIEQHMMAALQMIASAK